MRRVVMMFGVLALLAVTPVGALAQTAQQPAAPAQADPFTFNVDTVLLFFSIKEAQTADFESVMTSIKEILSKSDKPDRKSQAASFAVYRLEAAQNGVVTYAMLLDPATKGVTYDFGKILSEGMPPEKVQEAFTKLTGSFAGQPSIAPLRKVISKD
jgi:hypothetical protein